MRVLVSTRETQGQRANDFNFTEPDEVVVPGAPCDQDRRSDSTVEPDGVCGCGRAWTGLTSLRGTTTAKIVGRFDISLNDLNALIRTSLNRAGFADYLSAEEFNAAAAADLHASVKIVSMFPQDAILELRGDTIRARTMPSTDTV